jgi:hypothetical protein
MQHSLSDEATPIVLLVLGVLALVLLAAQGLGWLVGILISTFLAVATLEGVRRSPGSGVPNSMEYASGLNQVCARGW